jgi:hypothetical protein
LRRATSACDDQEWLDRSLAIRREHELTHYFTYRAFNSIRNNVFDELIADFVGLVRAFGAYRSDFALRFLGLEAYPAFPRRRPARGLPRQAAVVGRCVGRGADARGAERAQPRRVRQRTSAAPAIAGRAGALTFALTTLTLEELASADMTSLVRERLN